MYTPWARAVLGGWLCPSTRPACAAAAAAVGVCPFLQGPQHTHIFALSSTFSPTLSLRACRKNVYSINFWGQARRTITITTRGAETIITRCHVRITNERPTHFSSKIKMCWAASYVCRAYKRKGWSGFCVRIAGHFEPRAWVYWYHTHTLRLAPLKLCPRYLGQTSRNYSKIFFCSSSKAG